MNMKKAGFYIWMLITALFVISCSDDDDDNSDEEWKLKNEQAFDEIKNNTEYTELKSLTNAGSLYYKVLKAGDPGGEKPDYTSRAEVYYKGTYVVTDDNKGIKKGDVFDSKLFENGSPYNVALSSGASNYNSSSNPNGYRVEITGWTDALQHMVVGDKWEICVPYQLGYGETNTNNYNGILIQGNSTLVYEIELMKVVHIDDF